MTLPNVPSLSTYAASIDSAPSFLAAIGAPSPQLSRQHVQQLIDAAIACDRGLTSTGLSMSVVEDMDAFVQIVEAVGKFVPTVFDRKIKPTRRRGESLGLVVRDHHGGAALPAAADPGRSPLHAEPVLREPSRADGERGIPGPAGRRSAIRLGHRRFRRVDRLLLGQPALQRGDVKPLRLPTRGFA